MLHFNPQGSCEPRPGSNNIPLHSWGFQSTRLSRASTGYGMDSCSGIRHFNPQGSREPRPNIFSRLAISFSFQSTRLSEPRRFLADAYLWQRYFNPQGSREPRHCPPFTIRGRYYISIHKALASLDTNIYP